MNRPTDEDTARVVTNPTDQLTELRDICTEMVAKGMPDWWPKAVHPDAVLGTSLWIYIPPNGTSNDYSCMDPADALTLAVAAGEKFLWDHARWSLYDEVTRNKHDKPELSLSDALRAVMEAHG